MEQLTKELEDIVKDMEEVLEGASYIPLINKHSIDINRMKECIAELRSNTPSEIKTAKQIAVDRKSIIADANRQAEGIIHNAEERAKELIAQSEIIVQAKKIAADIIDNAKIQADNIVGEAEGNAQNIIGQAQSQADNIIGQAQTMDANIKQALAEKLDKMLDDSQRALNLSLNQVMDVRNSFNNLEANDQNQQ